VKNRVFGVLAVGAAAVVAALGAATPAFAVDGGSAARTGHQGFNLTAVGATANSALTGYTFQAHLGFKNTGAEPLTPSLANHVGFDFSVGSADVLSADPRCVALTDNGAPVTDGAGKPGAHRYACPAAVTAPGASDLATFTFRINDRPIQDWRIGTVGLTAMDNGALVSGYGDSDSSDDRAGILLAHDHDKHSNLAAVGATAASSKVGYTFPAHVGYRNTGTEPVTPSIAAHMGFDLSFGHAEAVSVDPRCVALTDAGTPVKDGAGKLGAHRYLCPARPTAPGASDLADFTLKIVDSGIQDYRIGTVSLTGIDNGNPVPAIFGAFDDDKAPIALSRDHDGNADSTGGNAGGTGGGGLPVTGSHTLAIAGTGAALLAAGAALYLVTRRRRVGLVSE
jgi:LPXTG-motif cell wall-anchored protein